MDKPVYRDLLRFWRRLFALGFGMGVITGIVLSYEIGTNWAGFSRAVSNVVGPLLMYEAATAFFLESVSSGSCFSVRDVSPAGCMFSPA